MGDGTNTDRYMPVQVIGLSGVSDIAGGAYHSLAVMSDGTVRAWGFNSYGQLGDGSNTLSNTPVQVNGLTGVTAVAGGNNHSLAVKSDGTVWAWGSNSYGQLGDGSSTDSNTPVQVNDIINATAIAGGAYHSLAVKSDGTVWAWGYNAYGQLGDGSNTDGNTPVQVNGLTGVTTISCGAYHSLAVKFANSIIILQPAGGDTWDLGSIQNITWTSSGFAGNVNIYISRDTGTTWQIIASDVSDSGSYSYRVIGPPTDLARIKIASVAEPGIFDVTKTNILIPAGKSPVVPPNYEN